MLTDAAARPPRARAGLVAPALQLARGVGDRLAQRGGDRRDSRRRVLVRLVGRDEEETLLARLLRERGITRCGHRVDRPVRLRGTHDEGREIEHAGTREAALRAEVKHWRRADAEGTGQVASAFSPQTAREERARMSKPLQRCMAERVLVFLRAHAIKERALMVLVLARASVSASSPWFLISCTRWWPWLRIVRAVSTVLMHVHSTG
eukprot:2653303-Pleurochrysis_carterae.AAC.1